jgi:hypothetical protein
MDGLGVGGDDERVEGCWGAMVRHMNMVEGKMRRKEIGEYGLCPSTHPSPFADYRFALPLLFQPDVAPQSDERSQQRLSGCG